MKYLQRILEIICGLFFLISGFGKLPNISGFQDLIIQYGFPFFQYMAPCIVLFEIFLGIDLILRCLQKMTTMLSLIIVIIFTVVYTYGYLKNSISDCGCFGNIIKSPPQITYIRNILLIIALSFVLYTQKDTPETIPQWKRRIVLTIMLPSVFMAGMTFRLNMYKEYKQNIEGDFVVETPLSKFSSLTTKQELLFFMTSHCPHCLNSIENYIAYKEKGIIDTVLCYMLVDDIYAQPDSMEIEFNNFYPDLEYKKVLFDSVSFIDAVPTSFLIIDGKIQRTFIGSLPSPFYYINL